MKTWTTEEKIRFYGTMIVENERAFREIVKGLKKVGGYGEEQLQWALEEDHYDLTGNEPDKSERDQYRKVASDVSDEFFELFR